MKRSHLVTLLLLLAHTRGAAAQTSRTDPTDLQAWAGAALTLDLPDRWEASLQYRARFVGDASTYHGSYITTEVSRRFGNYISPFVSFRLAIVDSATYYRIAAGAEADYERGTLTLSFRPSLQVQKQNFADNDEGNADTILRMRLRAKYEITTAVDVYVSTEPYFKFGGDFPIDNWRNTTGLRYRVNDAVRIDAFYIYRPDYAKSYNRTFHVIGLQLDFAMKP